MSNSSSRPRSQMAMGGGNNSTGCVVMSANNNIMNNSNNNINNNSYHSFVQPASTASLKYRFTANGGSGSGVTVGNQSRNNPIQKVKEFFIHNTHNPSLGHT